MRVVLLGPPGAGKGTQAQIFARDKGFEHLSTGELIRQEMDKGSELGNFAKEFYDRGDLVPDDVVIDMIKARLAQTDNVLLDGFPRTVIQAAALDDQLARANIPLDKVVYFQAEIEELAERLQKRREIEGRTDDEPEAMRHRFDVYVRETEPVADYYRDTDRLMVIDAIGEIDEIQQRLRDAIFS